MFLDSLPASTYLTLTSSKNNVNKGGEIVPGESLWDLEWALKKHEGAENSGFVFNEEKTSLFSLISVPQMKAWKMLTLGPNSLYLTVTRNLQTAFSQSYTLIPSYWG